MSDNERAAFEKWLTERYRCGDCATERTHDGLYYSSVSHPMLDRVYADVQMMWEAFRDGMRAAGGGGER